MTFDPGSGNFIIDQDAFEAFKLDPSGILVDSSLLTQTESGHFRVDAPGELSDALGWQVGDILVSVDGYSLRSLEGVAAAYAEIADDDRFALVVERRGEPLTLRYRIQ